MARKKKESSLRKKICPSCHKRRNRLHKCSGKTKEMKRNESKNK